MTVKELRDKLSYLPDECEVLIALSRDEIISVEIEPSKYENGRILCDCDDDEYCHFCDGSISDQEVFLRTK